MIIAKNHGSVDHQVCIVLRRLVRYQNVDNYTEYGVFYPESCIRYIMLAAIAVARIYRQSLR